MVFGLFFSKKSQDALPESVPLPSSPPPQQQQQQVQEDSPAAQTPARRPTPQAQAHLQLRTPSPSIHGAYTAGGSPPPTLSGLSIHDPASQMSPSRQPESSKDANALMLPPPPVHTPTSLATLIQSIPAKIVHTYLLTHIPGAQDDVIQSLGTFFESIAPPPKLHCVRCHKDYVDIENDDRSCLVPHDDESALVERVGLTTKKVGRRRAEGMEYETLWGCCGEVTDGNGDQGPPDGWCYEGKHTTDLKRARFRADSSPQNDKLVSCIRLNCHGIRSTLPRAAGRKRARSSVNYKESDGDDDASEGEHDSGMEEIVEKAKGKPKTPKSVKGKGKAKETVMQEDKMDVDEDGSEQMEDDSVSRTGSVRGRTMAKAKSRGGKAAKSAVGSPANPCRRPPPSKAQETPAKEATPEVEAMSPPKSVPASAKRRGRQWKSKEIIEDSDEEVGIKRKAGSASVSPSRNEPPRTRSQSRTRPAAERSPLAAKSPLRPKKAKGAAPETEEEEVEKPRKKRRVLT
ncbi:hypothetical protein NLI96_g9730 [Meripilus lineatus]|uniref:Uncharacterized protein n=1 Tax=Meripilus lineatus TaxID=2056292 RepID=A0AAD5UWF1_9APHY|nr:hypothetical protein NLI96_g9730 [Physisporinus lineatus]